jgi:hypothetical protein
MQIIEVGVELPGRSRDQVTNLEVDLAVEDRWLLELGVGQAHRSTRERDTSAPVPALEADA